jgi:hypothetical protein
MRCSTSKRIEALEQCILPETTASTRDGVFKGALVRLSIEELGSLREVARKRQSSPP